jgi:hypothetical protein
MSNEEQVARELAAHAKDMETLEQLGRSRYGSGNFDDMCENVVGRVAGKDAGKNVQFTGLLKQFDDPLSIIEHLDRHPERAEKIGTLTPQQQLVEMARIEAQSASYGRASGAGRHPAWATPGALRGDFLDPSTFNLPATREGEAEWERRFQRHQAQRRAMRGR